MLRQVTLLEERFTARKRVLCILVTMFGLAACPGDAYAMPRATAPASVAPSVLAQDAHDARALLRRLKFGATAKHVSSEPKGDKGVLGRAGATIGALRLVDKHGWWRASRRAATAQAYVNRHPPRGFVLSSDGPDYTKSGIEVGKIYVFFKRSTIGQARTIAVVVSVAPLALGGTGIRADVEIGEGAIDTGGY
jgi:hypothetical protein